MPLKTSINYSPNFNRKKRSKKEIKFIIIHYTGMKSENRAISRLCDVRSKVSCHYFIKKNGEIILMVPDIHIAWHAGISNWKKYKSLNKNSIGIEISNSGHNFKYKKFSKKQIFAIIKLSRFLKKKYNIKVKNFLGHSDIAPDRKIDPGEKFPWKYLSKKNICIWHNLKKLKKKKLIFISQLDKNYFLKKLNKFGYCVKYSNNNEFKKIVKNFQRRFRPELVNGKLDYECLMIVKSLI